MSKYTFTIGQGYDSHGHKLQNVARKRRNALQAIAKTFGGYTATPASGGWIDGGKLITEPSLAVTVYTDKPAKTVTATAQALRETFGQTSVLVTREPAKAQFVTA